jgi:uncharacterized protein YbaA (DUF1428 family)
VHSAAEARLGFKRNGGARDLVEQGQPNGGPMSHYIDAIVIPVPRANLDTYKRMSAEWGNAHLRHGALYYSDSISDDAQPGKLTSFPQAVQLKDGEVIALAWVVYRNKEDRDRISKAVMEDPQLKESMDPSKMPFDGKRMFWGGFETIIGLAGGPIRSPDARTRADRRQGVRDILTAARSADQSECQLHNRFRNS